MGPSHAPLRLGLQISVPVQPGNSRGPLLNLVGDVVGIVTAWLSDAAALEARIVVEVQA